MYKNEIIGRRKTGASRVLNDGGFINVRFILFRLDRSETRRRFSRKVSSNELPTTAREIVSVRTR